MPYKDPAKERAAALIRKHCHRKRLHEAKYGPYAGDMRGRHGNQARGAANGQWKAGRFITSHGYVAVRVPPDHPHTWGAHPEVKYAYEHILVMEEHLGRSLEPNELVHHGPLGKTVNAPNNLEVQTRSDHAKHHSSERGRDELGRFPPKDLRVREYPEERA
jgi:hypothetical protein